MLFLCIIVFAAAADLCAKAVINRKLTIGEKRELVKNRFYLWHIKNYGAAYNNFEGSMQWIIAISLGAMTFFSFHLIQEIKEKKQRGRCIFLSVLMGGALGNLLERMKFGYVTDFLYIKGKKTPIFNIADFFVATGGLFLVLSTFFGKEK